MPNAESPAAAARTLNRVAAPLRLELMAQLRDAIATSEFPPGARLVERVLCERYGVSRTVVREALRHLEAEGLVTTVANRGPVVTLLSPEDAADIFEVRAVVEALAAQRFAQRATEAERRALLAACDEVAAAFASEDRHRWLAAKDSYYEALLDGAHNEVARSTLLGLHARVQLLRGLSLHAPGRLDRSLAEIREVARLATTGEAERAFAAAKAHVERAAAAAEVELRAVEDVPAGGGAAVPTAG